MQPRQLTMKNFGPFINETVDFREFLEHGLFLVSGKTGAGKTTIFDGMTFALFGETSGRLRSGKEMRSSFAIPEEITSVTFSFEHQGLLYEIERSPEQEVKKKRGTGNKNQTAKVSLTISQAGKVQRQLTKRGEVDQFIKELLHMDARQFFQIILLPQGEFRNFLIASSGDKEKLLRNLFGTELYQRLNEWLSTQKKALEQVLTQQQHEMELLSSHFRWRQDPKPRISFKEMLEDWRIELEAIEQERAQVTQELILAKDAERQAQAALQEAQNQLLLIEEYHHLQDKQTALFAKEPEMMSKQELVQRLTWVEQQQGTLHNLSDVREESKIIEQRVNVGNEELVANELAQAAWQVAEKQLTTQRQALSEQQRDLQRIEELIPRAKEVENLRLEQSQLSKELAKIDLQHSQLAIRKQQLSVEQMENQKQLTIQSEIQAREIRLIEGKVLVERWREAQKNWKISQAKQLQGAQDISAMQEQLEELTQREKDAETDFQKARSSNAKMQIARLQLLLIEGEPCPVCGSFTHPVETSEQQYSSDQIEASEVALNEAEKSWQDVTQQHQMAQVQLSALKSQQQEQQAQVEIQARQLEECSEACGAFFECSLDQSPILLLQKITDQQATDKQRLATALKQQQQLAEQQEVCDEQLSVIQQAQKEQQAILQQLVAKIAVLDEQLQNQNYDTLQAEQKRLMTEVQTTENLLAEHVASGEALKINAASLNEALKQLQIQAQQLQEKQNKYQKQLQSALSKTSFEYTEATLRLAVEELIELPEYQEQLLQYQQEVAIVKQRLTELQEVEAMTPPEIDQLTQKGQLIESQREALQMKQIQQQEVYHLNHDIYQKLEKLIEANYHQLEELSQLDQLYRTMSGDNPGKISIERYVLQSFLAEILEVANQRLIKLTRGRYQFLLAEEKGSYRSSTGLEINIFDDNAGSSRRAHTLSGGESFIAALALALSLADVIQNRAGGIAIEALFIDEGFGSLDEDSLEMALEALELIENEGRLIGIISHVKELKDRIQQQVVVETNGSGQSRIKTRRV